MGKDIRWKIEFSLNLVKTLRSLPISDSFHNGISRREERIISHRDAVFDPEAQTRWEHVEKTKIIIIKIMGLKIP